MAEVRLEKVGKAYEGAVVLRDVNLDIKDGEFIVFVGPSGCGKSTLLRMIAGLEEISSGTLSIDGKRVNELPPAERGIAMVFQSYALYPHMNLAENMSFGLKLAGMSQLEIDNAVANAAKILHIDHLLDRKPKDLSGGQRQRVAIGRAIVRKPGVFLFDEPLSNLDAALRVRMRYEFAKLHEDLKRTMIYVTHDQVEAMTLADRIVVLSAGRVEQVGAPLELYEHPVNLFVAGFIGSPRMNFIGAEVVSATDREVRVRLATNEEVTCATASHHASAGDKVTLGVRPEHFHVGADTNALDVTVTFVESLGSSTEAYFAFPGTEAISCTLDGRTLIRQGDNVRLGVAPRDTYLFDAQGVAFPRPARAVA
ncbi:MAG: sn-glycerol-3-phosphate ABC transporter ATP-binding protein UgpC [Betaproteobacteria bacterium]|nr:sn-glycerol-3-phosphate ABC transporter ATP-binding protein UgpC [Betaproteobacteria bacterium]